MVPDGTGVFLQMFSSELCEIFVKTFFYRTPPVVASEKFNLKDLNGGFKNFKDLKKSFIKQVQD